VDVSGTAEQAPVDYAAAEVRGSDGILSDH